MINKEKLIEWCWNNLTFTNTPENWEETYIVDILNGYKGTCYTNEGKTLTYSHIREIFTVYPKQYVVIASNCTFKNMYITTDLKMVDGLQDTCIWEDSKDNIKAIVEPDSKKYKYEYKIEEF